MNCDITMDNRDMDFVLEDAFRIVKMRMGDDDGGGGGGGDGEEKDDAGGEGEKQNIDHNDDQMLTMMI